MVSLYGDAWDAGVLQGLKGLDCAGEGAGEDLAGVEQVAGDKEEIDLFSNGICDNAAEYTKEVFVAFGFAGRGAVGFAEVNVGGVEKFNHMCEHQKS